ncbi:imidazole glycerol phosphate synthase subunit HisH [candidate division KSB1 bacterium]|nr:imidazole glycerol phosphate synthase subunit HisH [candidate division KSB1 bacterium]
MIAMIDYKAGNLRSVAKALEAAGAKVNVMEDWKDLTRADKIVLPGVGAFGKAVEELKTRNLFEPIKEQIASGKPFLGICLGAQLLFESSDENPGVTGLSALKGKCIRFKKGLKVPHLGWNQVTQKTDSPIWKDVPDESFYYFAHSYYFQPDDMQVTTGQTEYGIPYTSAVWKNNIFGVQFHPEKSQKWGLKILENFIKL